MTSETKTIYEQTSELLSKLQKAVAQRQHFSEQTSSRTTPEYKDYAKELETDNVKEVKDNNTESQPVSVDKVETTNLETNPTPVAKLEPKRSILNTIEAELQEVEDKAPTTLPTISTPPDPIGFELWEALAYDLALENATPEVIANAYGVNPSQIEELKTNPYFDKMLRTKQEEVKQLGSDAAFVVKMRMVANRATPQFLQRLTSSATNNKDFHALFKTAVELAQLIPQDNNDDNVPQAVIGASVTFNIQGVPGLDHLSTTISTDTSANMTTPEVTEAEFTEIVDYQDSKLSTANNQLEEL